MSVASAIAIRLNLCTINSEVHPKISDFCKYLTTIIIAFPAEHKAATSDIFINAELVCPYLLFSTLITCFTFLEFRQTRIRLFMDTEN